MSLSPSAIPVRITVYPDQEPPEEIIPQIAGGLVQILEPSFENTPVLEVDRNRVSIDGGSAVASRAERIELIGRVVGAFWEPAKKYVPLRIHITPDLEGTLPQDSPGLEAAFQTLEEGFILYKAIRDRDSWPTLAEYKRMWLDSKLWLLQFNGAVEYMRRWEDVRGQMIDGQEEAA